MNPADFHALHVAHLSRNLPKGFVLEKLPEEDTSNTAPTDIEYQAMAKAELLSRAGFTATEYDVAWDDDLRKRFGTTEGETVDAYFAKRKLIEKELKDWSKDSLAALAQISLMHFDKSQKKIRPLKRTMDFSSIGMFFLFVAYPLYLLAHFISGL